MKKLSWLFLIALFTLFLISAISIKDVEAIPAFARQTGHACSTCHFQSFPTLNAFGRAFKAGGYTQIGEQGKIEDEGLSIPNVLNASLIAKLRYQKTDGTKNASDQSNDKSGTNKGELQFPDEASLLLGGRAAENIGFYLEASLGTGTDTFANFKVPIKLFEVSDTYIGLIPFTSATGGASHGFELLNTGSLVMQIPWDARTAISAQQYLGLSGDATTSQAEGLTLAIAHEMFFVNGTLWGPVHGKIATGTDLSNYIRAAVTPNIAGWDFALGAALWGGETKVGASDTGSANTETIYQTQAAAFDAQAQGEVGGMTLGIYLSYANAPKKDTGSTKTNLFNDSTTNDKNAAAVAVQLGVIPNKLTLGGAYRIGNAEESSSGKLSDSKTATTKRGDNALMLAAKYMLTQNVQLQLSWESMSGDKYDSVLNKSEGTNRMTFVLFSAF
ncbi:MAG: hypothetical protein AABZ11_04900 [Nitrospinota bacterium]